MELTRVAALPARFKPWQPRHVRLIDATCVVADKGTARRYLQYDDWCRAQDAQRLRDAGGVRAEPKPAATSSKPFSLRRRR
jgi:hypothetical protein